jgi:acetyl-CoA/propionyl-CoA carboxylase biotin carboxyl carrier protein
VRKVLIANRGEIAVRVIRACRDAGLGSVAIYAEQDIDGLHTRLADEAYALDGSTAAETYLDIEKIVKIASESGADAVHPGYGFLAENADFARAVQAASLTWIGPPPEAIEALGDKVQARHIALEVDAPLTPGTSDPVSGPEEVVAFAEEHGLPIAIKAAFGGGGRGLKVAWSMAEIPDQYESAVREAVAACASSSATWTSRGTWRPSAWPTGTATWWWSRPGTAPSSAATRSWSRRRPPRS